MTLEDEKQQLAGKPSKRMQPPSWLRWIRRAPGEPERSTVETTNEHLDVRATLRALPRLIDSSGLPNGVVELLVEDFQEPTCQLFDIQDGHIALVEPGKCVPWASIAGPATAWAMALGSERDMTRLRLTGDEQLARRVLAALPIRQPVKH